MPELPEVEVVRRGLAGWVAGRRIDDVEILHERPVRRHLLGAEDLRGNLIGTTVVDAVRRGKFLWLPLVDDDGHASVTGYSPAGGSPVGGPSPDPSPPVPRFALMAHLGMSGQLLIEDSDAPDEKHLRLRFQLSHSSPETAAEPLPGELRFVDQRMFGGMFLTELVPTDDGLPGGLSETPLPLIPEEAAHIARDPLDPAFDVEGFFRRLRKRRTGLKRALLDQGLISGVGNIYVDEALWAAKLHFARATDTVRRNETTRLVEACQQVMLQALEAGGTSFDALYVNVNGASGYFERSLNVYGREGEPCRRCAALGLATTIRRDVLMKRSSYTCPVCQPRPRNGRW
ncbi:bifunctional DNA-formamidopyrimidine glycosylase/DNA-(apurinic or apyrimidinic site) lyase [Arthrobacter castelli]|uniref:bifunctional DNA-formamidopyrimidine glycosylase/DNA-(apurinic or apyrimidinic site) lyase n=1 Tax=Arthrobacter castelli TaxID=271431 RepID=UPI0003F94A96|nr:bifunctional DNA-formamidopyrimidine glycosylase/DNA-(apurinic or apyrimidinic site) lyase [Arthrobacter castelli]